MPYFGICSWVSRTRVFVCRAAGSSRGCRGHDTSMAPRRLVAVGACDIDATDGDRRFSRLGAGPRPRSGAPQMTGGLRSLSPTCAALRSPCPPSSASLRRLRGPPSARSCGIRPSAFDCVPAGDGVVQSDADGRYRLSWHDARGQLRRITERVAGRAPVSDDAFRAANGDWQRFSDSMRSPNCEGEIVRYAEKPSIRALLPDPEGRLWVEQQRSDGVFYEIWSGDSLVAQLAAPERVESLPPAMLRDRLAVVRELPDGGHELRLFRITREAHVGTPQR